MSGAVILLVFVVLNYIRKRQGKFLVYFGLVLSSLVYLFCFVLFVCVLCLPVCIPFFFSLEGTEGIGEDHWVRSYKW